MKHITLLCILLTVPVILHAQNQVLTQSIKGKVTDTDTQIPLPGASVIILGSDPLLGAISDFNGNYKIPDVPIGRQNIVVSFIGYEDAYFSEVTLTTGAELVLNVMMREAIGQLDEIVIRPEEVIGEPINEMVTVSAQKLTVESTSRIAAGINDPGRTIQSYAGVASADDENNEIVVRGNSPRGMLWRMEGVEIPNPNHFSDGEGGSGGGVSALSTEVLNDSDFFSGAFAAEYGNALSSVFDLRLRNGNFEKQEYTLQVGVLGIQAAMEGPLSKKSEASYLLNYRYSTTSLLNNAGFEIGDSDVFPEWQDLSLNINLPTKKAGRFNVWGLGGISSAANLAETDTSEWVYRSDTYSDSERHDLGIIGVSNNYLFKNNKSFLKTVASYSHTNNMVDEDSLSFDLNKTLTKNEDFAYNTFTLSTFVNHKFNAKHKIRTGIIYTNQAFNLKAKNFNYDTNTLDTEILQTGSTDRFQSYFQWNYRLNPSLNLNTGVHYTYLKVNQDYSIEPRLGLSWYMNNAQSFSFGMGLHSRSEPVSIYMAQRKQDDGSVILPNQNLKMTRAFHLVVGYDWVFANNFRFKAEGYYQYLFDVPVQLDDTTGTKSALNFGSGFTNENFANDGTGRNYGLELTVEKSFSRHYYMMATASLFESKYTMPDGIERNTRYNSKYIYNFIGGKEFEVGRKKQHIIGANVRMICRGGYRTVPVNVDASNDSGEEIRDYDQAFDTKAPDYFRLDVGANFRKNMPKWSWVLSVDIQNVTSRMNVWGEYYNAESSSMEQIYMVGLLPIINYKVEF